MARREGSDGSLRSLVESALVTGIWRRRAAYRGTQDGSQHPKRHPGGTEKAPLANMGVSILKVGGSGPLEVCVSGTVWSQSDRS